MGKNHVKSRSYKGYTDIINYIKVKISHMTRTTTKATVKQQPSITFWDIIFKRLICWKYKTTYKSIRKKTKKRPKVEKLYEHSVHWKRKLNYKEIPFFISHTGKAEKVNKPSQRYKETGTFVVDRNLNWQRIGEHGNFYQPWKYIHLFNQSALLGIYPADIIST